MRERETEREEREMQMEAVRCSKEKTKGSKRFAYIEQLDARVQKTYDWNEKLDEISLILVESYKTRSFEPSKCSLDLVHCN